MFLVIPFVEFRHVLGVDINVHHENPATFLCHMSVSSVKSSRHRFASPRWHPVLTPGAQAGCRCSWPDTGDCDLPRAFALPIVGGGGEYAFAAGCLGRAVERVGGGSP